MRGSIARVSNRPKSRSKSSRNQAGCNARIKLIEYMRGCLPLGNQLSDRFQRYTHKSNNKMECRRLCACTLAGLESGFVWL
jgi:hypothetical protein